MGLIPDVCKMKNEILKILVAVCFLIPGVGLAQEYYEFSTKSKKAKKYYEAGEELIREQRIEEAKINFLYAIEEDPKFYEAWMMVGEIYEHQENDSLEVKRIFLV